MVPDEQRVHSHTSISAPAPPRERLYTQVQKSVRRQGAGALSEPETAGRDEREIGEPVLSYLCLIEGTDTMNLDDAYEDTQP